MMRRFLAALSALSSSGGVAVSGLPCLSIPPFLTPPMTCSWPMPCISLARSAICNAEERMGRECPAEEDARGAGISGT
eukprot:1159293-Pelagomonas_calceolata.AAC.3